MKELIKHIENGKLLLEVNNNIYHINAITQTAYKFTDKCYINIEPLSEDVVGIYFTAKDESKDIEESVNNFCNELIDQQVRYNTEKEYGNIRDEIVKKAFSAINR